MSKIVSIIGCGNIGLPLAKLLVQDGYLVKGSTTQKSKLPILRKAGVQSFLINLTDESDRLFADLIHADIVIITFPPAFGQGSDKSYADQLQFVCKKIQEANIKKVLFTSSTDLYPQNNNWVYENDATINKPRFTDTPVLTLEKIFSEQINFKTTILRFAGLMGPSYGSSFQVAGRNMKGADDPINMVHQDDCVAIMHTIIKRNIWGEIFNVVTDQHPTKREYYNQLCDSLGLTRPTYVNSHANYRLVSNNILKQTLKYQFLYPNPLRI